MKKIQIGLSRLYNTLGISVSEGHQLKTEFVNGDIKTIFRLSSKHLLPVYNHTFKRTIKRSDSTEKEIEFKIPSPEIYPAESYAEFTSFKTIEVEDVLADSFLNKDKLAASEINKRARDLRSELQRALDFYAGYIGLTVSNLLVRIPISEQSFVIRSQGDPVSLGTDLLIRTIPHYVLKDNDIREISENVESKQHVKIDFNSSHKILGWLTRGWESHSQSNSSFNSNEKILKFFSFFTALECVIPALSESDAKGFSLNLNKIIDIVEVHSDPDDRENLVELLKKVKRPSISISQRFEELAKKVNPSEWQKDVKAFDRFNKIRNFLIHRGEAEVELKVPIEVDDISTLEDLTLRYVSYELFGKSDLSKNHYFIL